MEHLPGPPYKIKFLPVFTTLVFLLSLNSAAFRHIQKKPISTFLLLAEENSKKVNLSNLSEENRPRIVSPGNMLSGPARNNTQDDPVFTIVEQQPEFPGGLEAMTQFILRNIRMPQDPRYMNAQGTVYAQFIVSKRGKIKDIKIVKGLNHGADLEAKKLISRMPDWIPGQQNGKPVNVQYTLPLRFQFKTETKRNTKPG